MCPKANIRWIDMNEITNEKPQTEQPQPETEQPKPIQPSVVQPSVVQPTVQPTVIDELSMPEVKQPNFKETAGDDYANSRMEEMITPHKRKLKENDQIKVKH